MTIFNPADSAALLTAITDCTFGDTIQLTAGSVYETTSSFLFPNKGAGTDYITITTSNTAVLPAKLAAYPMNYSFTDPSLYRITTAEAANMPKIRAASALAEPAISFATGAHHWKFIGIEVTNRDVGVNSVDLMGTYTGDETVPNMAHHLYFDRCFLHPAEETGDISVNYQLRTVEKGCIFNGSDFTFTHCAFQGFTGRNLYTYGGYPSGGMPLDSNGVLFGAGAGNWVISNCLIEGQGNNMWLGGGGNQGTPASHEATISSPAVTSGTFSGTTDLVVGDMFGVYVDAIHSRNITTNDDPDGANPTPVISGWAVGKILTVDHGTGAVTFQNLTTSYNYRVFRIKFGTGVTGGTFTFTYSGQTTSAISFSSNRTTLASNIQTAIGALSNVGSSNIEYVNGNAIYVSSPTYGAEIKFIDSFAQVFPSEVSVDGANLTGSGTVTVRIEPAWSEYYTNVATADAPTTGAAVKWRGYLPDTVTVTQNIIAKYPLWFAYLGPLKGFGEMKSANNVLFEGNIWSGQATGMILEVKNQSGAEPWSTVSNVTFRHNLWTDTGIAIAMAPTDTQSRATSGHDWMVTNNLFLKPAASSGALTGVTYGGSNVTWTHNTIFAAGTITDGVSGADYDRAEDAGFSQLHNWIVKDNIFRQRGSFFRAYRSTTGAPYNNGDIRDCWPDMTADHNVVIDDTGIGNSSGFFTIHPNNYHPVSVSAVGFTDAPVDLDYTGDYRLTAGSAYHNAGSDGEDIGVDYDALIVGLGFDPFTSEPAPGNVTIRARYRMAIL